MLKWGWPIIKKALPKATFDICYGWNLFDAVHRNNPERMMFKKELIKLMAQEGVKEHGRIGHSQLIKLKFKASIHYYPTDFEEIDCIAVRESAMAGCVPIISDYAALAEKTYGVKISGNPRTKEFQEKAARKAIQLIKSGEIEKYRENKPLHETWEEIAKQWDI